MARPRGEPAAAGALLRARCAWAVFAGLGLVAAQAGGDALARADDAASAAVAARRCPAGVAVARAVSALAEPEVVYPLLAAAGMAGSLLDGGMAGSLLGGANAGSPRAGWQRAGTQRAVLACAGVAGGAVARRVLCDAIARPRPPAARWLAQPEGFSLPSRHTAVAALAAGAGAHALGLSAPQRQAARLLAAGAVGLSRVYLGVHWPSDALAGWLFAEGWLRLTARA